MDVSEISQPYEWSFLGEGGANIVFSYSGCHSYLVGKVLRIRKRGSGHQFDTNQLILKHELQRYAEPTENVEFGMDFMTELFKAAFSFREDHRLQFPDRPDNFGSLCTNYHHSSDQGKFYSIEIKPKWTGALAFLGDVDCHSTLHQELCRFCNHNYSIDRIVSRTPRYCPADLYSKNLKRIRHAIECLCQEPRNNLRAFIGGKPIMPHLLPVAIRIRISNILTDDVFLGDFEDRLVSAWRGLVNECSEEECNDTRQNIREAVMLRDCSFIVGMTVGSQIYRINLIDLDHKHDEKMDYYRGEIRNMFSLISKREMSQ